MLTTSSRLQDASVSGSFPTLNAKMSKNCSKLTPDSEEVGAALVDALADGRDWLSC